MQRIYNHTRAGSDSQGASEGHIGGREAEVRRRLQCCVRWGGGLRMTRRVFVEEADSLQKVVIMIVEEVVGRAEQRSCVWRGHAGVM